MSRVGKKIVVLPDKVSAEISDGKIKVKGPIGNLTMNFSPRVTAEVNKGTIVVKKKDESRESDAEQGMMRAIINNMVTGVSKGFSKSLDIVGVGYKADMQGKNLTLAMGFSHPVLFPVPEGITIKVEKQTRIVVSGPDRQLVGETAARIRKIRPPEPYKGKGIRYVDEYVRRKVGKAAAAATGGA